MVERPETKNRDVLGAERENTLEAELAHGEHRAPAHVEAQTRSALLHLTTAAVAATVLALSTYAIPSARMFRPWVPGEGMPIVRMFDRERGSEGMELATGGAVTRATSSEQRRRLAARNLGENVAANLDEDEQAPPERDPSAAVRIDPGELEGLTRELEDEGGRAMQPFYEALLRTAQREAGAITRIAHYGDSSIAGDGITSTARRRFQQRFGDAGHGFILIARGTMPYRHVDVEHQASDDWRLIELIRAGMRDRMYGYGGVQYRSSSGATARFGTVEEGPIGTHVSRFELWFQRHSRGGRVDFRVDGGERAMLETRGETQADDWHTIEVPDGPHRLELRTIGGGEARLYGMVLERDGPGVVYDSLGMVGARARRMTGYDPAHFARQHEHRATNLIVLGFGGNDADDNLTSEQYERDFREVARMVRQARPQTACLLMAPLDQAVRDERGSIETMPTVPLIVEAMRRAAVAEGCAFFDTFTAMGGVGAMRAWFRSTPRLAFGDFRHATPAGYRVIGNMLYKALLKGFADYLARTNQAR